jgi:protein CpxP
MLKNLLTKTGLAVGLVASMSAVGFAQQTQDGTGDAAGQHERMGHDRKGGRHGKMGKHGGGLRGLRALNLTDAQREQIRTARENHARRTETQREELRQLFTTRRQGGELTAEQQTRAAQLRSELAASAQSFHNELLNLLTPEQRAQFEQQQQERKARRQEFRQRRQQLREERRQERRQQRGQEGGQVR